MTARLPRRQLLLDAAADLFSSRGYHDVGIDDIGAAAGISGPGVYRHFPSKQALLGDLCERAMARMLQCALEVAAEERPLDRLLDLHVDFAVRERELLAVWTREQRALSQDVRRSLRQQERAYEQVWRDVLLGLRADLTADEAQLVVLSTLAMLNSAALTAPGVPPDRQAVLLRGMALAALTS